MAIIFTPFSCTTTTTNSRKMAPSEWIGERARLFVHVTACVCMLEYIYKGLYSYCIICLQIQYVYCISPSSWLMIINFYSNRNIGRIKIQIGRIKIQIHRSIYKYYNVLIYMNMFFMIISYPIVYAINSLVQGFTKKIFNIL